MNVNIVNSRNNIGIGFSLIYWHRIERPFQFRQYGKNEANETIFEFKLVNVPLKIIFSKTRNTNRSLSDKTLSSD